MAEGTQPLPSATCKTAQELGTMSAIVCEEELMHACR